MHDLKVLEIWMVNFTLNIQHKTSPSSAYQVPFKIPHHQLTRFPLKRKFLDSDR